MDDVQKIILDRLDKLEVIIHDGFSEVHKRINKIDQFKYKIYGALVLFGSGATLMAGIMYSS